MPCRAAAPGTRNERANERSRGQGGASLSHIRSPRAHFRPNAPLALYSRSASLTAAQLCRGVIVHAFSNGGALVYAEILKRARGRPTEFLGAVFDSCPGSISSIASGARAFLATQPSALSIAAVGGAVLGAPVAIVALLRAAFSRVGAQRPTRAAVLAALVLCALYAAAQRRKSAAFLRGLSAAARTAPELYCYSDGDAVVPAAPIAALIARRMRGAPGKSLRVVQRRWKASGHVAHFRIHRTEYVEAVLNFVSAVATGAPLGALPILPLARHAAV